MRYDNEYDNVKQKNRTIMCYLGKIVHQRRQRIPLSNKYCYSITGYCFQDFYW